MNTPVYRWSNGSFVSAPWTQIEGDKVVLLAHLLGPGGKPIRLCVHAMGVVTSTSEALEGDATFAELGKRETGNRELLP